MTQTSGNYVAAWIDHSADKIIVLERDADGDLSRVQYEPPYHFYVEAEEGDYKSIFGHTLRRIDMPTRRGYDAAKQYARTHGFKLFESDISPLKRILMDRYYERPTPPVNYVLIDIEVDYKQSMGFAGPTNPYAPINAVTIYQSWTKSLLTAVVPPLGWFGGADDLDSKIQQLIEKRQLRAGNAPKIHVCASERELLDLMLAWIAEADILSGWNSELYDLPYICERLLVLGGEPLLSKLDYPGARLPKKDTVKRFGTEQPTYRFAGRSHIDYMRLFQKFAGGGRASFALANILMEEVGVGKLDYDGTLENLYNFDFPTFVAYNFRDVDGLVQLDAKFKFIALINQVAHENTVNFEAILGTVAYVETGIANYAHHKLNRIVNDKSKITSKGVEGAVVLIPKAGLHENIGSVDVSSLYPNTIRSLNISPEKIVGQFVANEQAWHEIRARSATQLTLMRESGQSETASASEWRERLLNNRWAVSGFGTVFDQSAGPGLVPAILGYWYAERKRMQAEKKKYTKLAHEESDAGKKAEYKRLEAHYDLLQVTKKISMNSLYGALLNAGFRFGDERMGASTTGTGRQITTHMVETIAYLLTGENHKLRKTTHTDKKGHVRNDYAIDTRAVIYGDTDSCYFNTGADTVADAIKIADGVAQLVNESFPGFMREACLCQSGFDSLISVNREIVGSRGLFLKAKKKYTIKVVDQEGLATDKIKSQGSEIKKSDTPKVIQKLMTDVMRLIFDGKPHAEVVYFVITRRAALFHDAQDLFLLGTAKQVNALEKHAAAYNVSASADKMKSDRKRAIPGHCRAALNYNWLVSQHEKGAKPIRSGDKALIYYLGPNQYEFKSVALPAEAVRFPEWFTKAFQIDVQRTMLKLLDSRLDSVFEAFGREASPEALNREAVNAVTSARESESGHGYLDWLPGANLLLTRYRGPTGCYGFEDTWAFLRALYGNKPIPQLVDEFTTQATKDGLL